LVTYPSHRGADNKRELKGISTPELAQAKDRSMERRRPPNIRFLIMDQNARLTA
jgi:hypothetical protein